VNPRHRRFRVPLAIYAAALAAFRVSPRFE